MTYEQAVDIGKQSVLGLLGSANVKSDVIEYARRYLLLAAGLLIAAGMLPETVSAIKHEITTIEANLEGKTEGEDK